MKRQTVPHVTVPGWMPAIVLGFGGIVSLVWLGMVYRYVSGGPGWDHILASHPTDFAIFLAAVGAPLAGVWLVAAFLLLASGQRGLQAALMRASWQAGRTTEEIEALVRTSIEMQELARRQSFLNGADLALKDLNSQAGMIVGRLGILAPEDTENLWALNAAGDPWAFCHALLERSVRFGFIDDLVDGVAGDEVALAGLHRFLRRYERLLALAKEYDADKLVREILEDGPLDRVHALFFAVARGVQARLAPPSPADGWGVSAAASPNQPEAFSDAPPPDLTGYDDAPEDLGADMGATVEPYAPGAYSQSSPGSSLSGSPLAGLSDDLPTVSSDPVFAHQDGIFEGEGIPPEGVRDDFQDDRHHGGTPAAYPPPGQDLFGAPLVSRPAQPTGATGRKANGPKAEGRRSGTRASVAGLGDQVLRGMGAMLGRDRGRDRTKDRLSEDVRACLAEGPDEVRRYNDVGPFGLEPAGEPDGERVADQGYPVAYDDQRRSTDRGAADPCGRAS